MYANEANTVKSDSPIHSGTQKGFDAGKRLLGESYLILSLTRDVEK